MVCVKILNFLSFFISYIYSSAYAGYFDNLDSSGELNFEFRRFYNDHDSTTQDSGIAMRGFLDLRYDNDDFLHVLRVVGSSDKKDKDRGNILLEDFYLSTKSSVFAGTKFLIGYKIFNWTALEAFHPADIINSRDYDSELENFAKKGEPTLEAQMSLFSGNLSLFYLPKFEAPLYPSKRSRLGAGTDIEKPKLILKDKMKEYNKIQTQYGARLFQTFGSLDIGVHYVNHIDRNYPIIGTHEYMPHMMNPNIIIPLSTLPVPYYFEVEDMGGTLQYVWGSAIHKVEMNHKKFKNKNFPIFSFSEMILATPKDFTEAAYGLEYSHTWDSGHDSTFLLEFIGMFGTEKLERQKTSILQRDILIGYRHAFNDTMGKEFFVSVLHDVERKNERLVNFNYSQRLSDFWKIKLNLRIFDAPIKEITPKGLERFNKDHYALVSLSRYF